MPQGLIECLSSMKRVGTTDMALVFRCETDAKGVAAAIHANCLRLANEIKD